MTYENPYGENPDPKMEDFERKQAGETYWQRTKIKKAMSKLDFDKIPSNRDKFKAIKDKYLS